MSMFDRIAEEKIRAAMESGEWNNLPGKGQPLKLEENPHEPPGSGMAYRLLRDNGFTLPWIEERKEIEADLASERQNNRQAWAQATTPAEREAILTRNFAQIEAMNRRIFHYNLQAPSAQFQMARLDPQQEVAALQNQGNIPGESG